MAECDSLRLTVQAFHIAEELTSLANKTRPLSLCNCRMLSNCILDSAIEQYKSHLVANIRLTQGTCCVYMLTITFFAVHFLCTLRYLYMTQAKHRNTDDACFRMKEHMCGTCRVINIHVNNFPCIKPILEYIQWLDNWCTNRSRSHSKPYGLCLYLWMLQVWFCSLLTV